MHDPMVVVFDIRRPVPRRTKLVRNDERWSWHPPFAAVAGRGLYFPSLITVWHVEPDGHDSGEVCKGMRGSRWSWNNVTWAARHWRHLHLQISPVQTVRHWFARCDECKRRMHRSVRHGYMSSDKTYHAECMSLRHVRGQLADANAYIDGTADQTQKWRVEYAREHRLVKAAEAIVGSASEPEATS